jgi:hypothetical protein
MQAIEALGVFWAIVGSANPQLFFTLLQLLPQAFNLLICFDRREFSRCLQVANVANALSKLLQIRIKHEIFGLDLAAIPAPRIEKV